MSVGTHGFLQMAALETPEFMVSKMEEFAAVSIVLSPVRAVDIVGHHGDSGGPDDPEPAPSPR
jgi:hypothetical protein